MKATMDKIREQTSALDSYEYIMDKIAEILTANEGDMKPARPDLYKSHIAHEVERCEVPLERQVWIAQGLWNEYDRVLMPEGKLIPRGGFPAYLATLLPTPPEDK